MSEFQIENEKNRNDDIDSKIADFMADIDEIVGKKSNFNNDDKSEWKEFFDETSQSIYYWNTKTNQCSWNLPQTETQNEKINQFENVTKKRSQSSNNEKSAKKLKKTSLIAEYTSSESEEEEEEENLDDIDELLNEVLDKKDKTVQSTDSYPTFEADCRAAIERLNHFDEKSTEILTLKIQLETRLTDCLTGYLSKSYAVNKFQEALIKIEEFEKFHQNSIVAEPLKPSLSSSEMALLLSLPPPPPPPSSPPPGPSPQLTSTNDDEEDKTLQLFYAQLNCDQTSSLIKSDQRQQHHHHKDKKSKKTKTLPTDLIQKWTHARQELLGIPDTDDS